MTESDEKLLQRYRELAREEPARAVDEAILAASRRAVARPSLARRWAPPLSIAAVLVLAFGVTLEMQREQPRIEYREGARPAPASKPQLAPTPAPPRAPSAEPAPNRQAPPPARGVEGGPRRGGGGGGGGGRRRGGGGAQAPVPALAPGRGGGGGGAARRRGGRHGTPRYGQGPGGARGGGLGEPASTRGVA